MAVGHWPQIAENVAKRFGGVRFTGVAPSNTWAYQLTAAGVATRGRVVELGSFAFPTAECAFCEAMMVAITEVDGMIEITVHPLARPSK